MTTVDQGTAQLAAIMAEQAGAGPGLHVDAGVGLDLRIGRLCSLLEAEQRRRSLLAQLVNVIDLPPLDFIVQGAKPKLKSYRAAATDLSPQEGYLWFVQRVTIAGLNAGDIVNLHRTVSSTNIAPMTALHQFIAPAGPAAGLVIVDWEPGGTGLTLRSDDSLWLDGGGTLTAAEIVLTGQAIQVHLSQLAEYLM